MYIPMKSPAQSSHNIIAIYSEFARAFLETSYFYLWPQTAIDLLSLDNLAISRISNQWNHIAWTLVSGFFHSEFFDHHIIIVCINSLFLFLWTSLYEILFIHSPDYQHWAVFIWGLFWIKTLFVCMFVCNFLSGYIFRFS